MNNLDIIKKGLLELQPQHPEVDEMLEALAGMSSSTVRIWHGSFDGDMGTLSHVAMSEREFEDWLLAQVGQDREAFNAWHAAMGAGDDRGLDDFLRTECDHCDSWTWDSFDVPVPGIGQPPRVVVALDGGLVSCASSDVPVDLVVIDYDVEGADKDDIADFPQSGRDETEEALIRGVTVDVDPLWTNAVFAVEAAHWPDGHEGTSFITETGIETGIIGVTKGLVACQAHGRTDPHPCGDDLEDVVAAAEASFGQKALPEGDEFNKTSSQGATVIQAQSPDGPVTITIFPKEG